jgi:hypothetical protein
MEDRSVGYRYYSQLLNPSKTSESSSEKIDLNEWVRLLNTEQSFAPGGRYGIIREHFSQNRKGEMLLEIDCGSGVNVARLDSVHPPLEHSSRILANIGW